MAKISNDDATRDALAICDRLDAVSNLNKSSAALSRMARNWLTLNPHDARYALENAKLADYVHYFCTDMNLITEDSVSYQTMINDPTSALYHN